MFDDPNYVETFVAPTHSVDPVAAAPSKASDNAMAAGMKIFDNPDLDPCWNEDF